MELSLVLVVCCLFIGVHSAPPSSKDLPSYRPIQQDIETGPVDEGSSTEHGEIESIDELEMIQLKPGPSDEPSDEEPLIVNEKREIVMPDGVSNAVGKEKEYDMYRDSPLRFLGMYQYRS